MIKIINHYFNLVLRTRRRLRKESETPFPGQDVLDVLQEASRGRPGNNTPILPRGRASLGVMGGRLKASCETLQTSQHYGIEGFKKNITPL